MSAVKPQMPWSIKGVPEDVRNIAREKAQQAGLTMGAWLTQLITGEEGSVGTCAVTVSPPAPVAANDSAIGNSVPKHENSNAELAQLVLTVAKRVAVLENDTAAFAGSFQDQLSDLRKRMLTIENERAIPATVQTAFSQE